MFYLFYIGSQLVCYVIRSFLVSSLLGGLIYQRHESAVGRFHSGFYKNVDVSTDVGTGGFMICDGRFVGFRLKKLYTKAYE